MLNLYDADYDKITDEELIDIVYEDNKVRIERIISMGHTTPENFEYDQSEDEFVSVLDGEAEILLTETNETIALKKGDSYMLLAGVKHRVTKTSSPCIWLCVFTK